MVGGIGTSCSPLVIVGSSTGVCRTLYQLVRMHANFFLVYQFLDSGMLFAPIVGFFFLMVTVIQLLKGFLVVCIICACDSQCGRLEYRNEVDSGVTALLRGRVLCGESQTQAT